MKRVSLLAPAALLALPASAGAHGFVTRADLPVPEWLFGWAAAIVLIASFVALAVLWPEPKLEQDRWRALSAAVGRTLTSLPVQIVLGGAAVFLLAVVVYSGLAGAQSAKVNFAPTFVYVVFWLGLVPVSVVFGDVFRAVNPWRAIGRAVGWSVRQATRGSPPQPLPYPERLGRWPAAAGLFAFAALELVAGNGAKPENVATAALLYTAATLAGMALYGVEAWTERGEAFSVYFNLFSRLSPLEVRGRRLGVRLPLSGLPRLRPLPGTVPLLAVMIGSVTFDGASETSLWTGPAPDIRDFFQSLGLSLVSARRVTYLLGLLACIGLVYGFYRLGTAAARTVGGGFTGGELADAFVHSLVPISLAYVGAHYITLLLFQGQAIVALASDPLGHHSDLFGTADRVIDYGVIGVTATWYWQVGFVVVGHVLALTLAHDRALALYDDVKRALRSQYWLLGVMIGFTSLALWLLSQSNR